MELKLKLPVINLKLDVSRRPRSPNPPLHGTVINRNYDKVFVIGFNKTGTTTLSYVLKKFGFKLGNQAVAEILDIEWGETGKTDKIFRYCETAEAFQDRPFSRPELYKVLDREFPKSKFILSVRDSGEQWFQSLVSYHSKCYTKNKSQPPSEKDLANALYRYKGMMLDAKKLFYDYPSIPLYDKKSYINKYRIHNEDVRSYFANRPNDFIEINVAKTESFKALKQFLNVESAATKFPWRNRTQT
ncbi:MAG: hypothetical protein GVY08_10495 [Bacteroidetes bacterium]|jgi:hypothetical protein|nr:hypothetical protein [Bacteroidota bacterium]